MIIKRTARELYLSRQIRIAIKHEVQVDAGKDVDDHSKRTLYHRLSKRDQNGN